MVTGDVCGLQNNQQNPKFRRKKISKGELNGSNNLTKIDGRQLLKKQNHDEFVETVNKTQERHKLRTVE